MTLAISEIIELPHFDYQRICEGMDDFELDQACRNLGFFELINHPLSPSICDELLDQMKIFFSLPSHEKNLIKRTPKNHWGFYDRELTKNKRDWKEIFDVGHEYDHCIPQWPRDVPGFRAVIRDYYVQCEKVAIELVGCLGRILGTNSNVLTTEFKNSTSFLRLNHYPTCKSPAASDSPDVTTSGELGIGHHTDSGAITLLLHDGRDGLQIKYQDIWQTLITSRGSLIVNIGDIIQVWSNDRYKAPSHRVLSNDKEIRFSAPFFLNPSLVTTYSPLPTATKGIKAKYRPIKWRNFRDQRAAGDYANYGEEIQIDNYRVDDS